MNQQTMEKQEMIFENFIQEHWTQQEKENVEIVMDFFQKLMNEHDFEYIRKKYGQGSYIQHNRAIPDGVSGLISYIKDLVKRFPEYSYNLKKVYVDKDFVIFHSHVTMKAKHRGNEKKGFIITDTFKVEKGKLAEHWDAMQPIDTFSRWLFFLIGGAVRNNNSIF